jgi:two-component system nitrate/nitrite response regulator NarL
MVIQQQAMVRAGLRLLLESHSRLTVIGEASNRMEALAVATREQPDVILLDADSGVEISLEILPELFAAVPETRVITITSAQDPELDQKAVCLGAVGLVTKNQPAEVLFQAIEKIHAGEAWIDRCMVARAHRELTRPSPDTDREASRIATLTGRQREVLGLVAQGLKNGQIAARLFIAEATVRHHLTSIFEKMGVGDRLSLVIHAYRYGLVETPRRL